MLRQRDQEAVRAKDAGLFSRDGGKRRPEPALVIHGNVGHYGYQRVHDIGRIEPPAQPYLKHCQVDRRVACRELEKCDRCDHLEKGRRVGKAAFSDQFCRGAVYLEEPLREFLVLYLAAIDPDAFIRALQVWRGVEPNSKPRSLQNGRERRRGRTLAICAGNQNRREAPLGVAKRGEQGAHVGELKLAPRLAWRRRSKLAAKCEQAVNGGLGFGGHESSVEARDCKGSWQARDALGKWNMDARLGLRHAALLLD